MIVRSRSLLVVEEMIVCGGRRAESGQRGTAHRAPPHVSVGKYLRNVSDPDVEDKRPACDSPDNKRAVSDEEEGCGHQQGLFRGPGIDPNFNRAGPTVVTWVCPSQPASGPPKTSTHPQCAAISLSNDYLRVHAS